MASVKTSLNRAAVATVVLLLGVLLIVYRSVWLALVPLTTIGVSLVISRSVLAWLNLAGWDVSPLVELFLVALLFGSGTDFCLLDFMAIRRALGPADPGRAMRVTLERASAARLDQRRDGDRRAFLDGNDSLQAVFEHGPERRARARDHPPGDTDVDARACWSCWPASARRPSPD